MRKVQRIYSGTSGLVVPVRQSLYPPEFKGKSRLTYYASLFNSIEINSSFYRTPKVSTVIKWAESVPLNFRFTFKLSKAITHVRGLDFNAEDLRHFMQVIDYTGDKKGCLLIQLPPGLKVDKMKSLENLLRNITHGKARHAWKIAVEFRNVSWYHAEVYHLLNEYKSGMVMHDLPGSGTQHIELSEDFRYLRFHGPEGGYRGSYPDEFLKQYAQNIKDWTKKGKAVYVYFNNTMGDAVKNLQTLNELLK